MAAQVLSGTGALAYTNNTGENVRIVINFLKTGAGPSNETSTISWGGGASVEIAADCSMGRNLAFLDTVTSAFQISGIAGQNAFTNHAGGFAGAPTEIALANTDTFSISDPHNHGLVYNILVIPESG